MSNYKTNEVELAARRAALRETLRQEFLKQSTNPHKFAAGKSGFVFDSGVQRYMSMRTTLYEHFKPTTRSFFLWMGICVFPIWAYGFLLGKQRAIMEAKYRSGEIPYKDRMFKYQ